MLLGSLPSPNFPRSWCQVVLGATRGANGQSASFQACPLSTPVQQPRNLILCPAASRKVPTMCSHQLAGQRDMKACRDPGSNRGPPDLQSDALPTELSRLDKEVVKISKQNYFMLYQCMGNIICLIIVRNISRHN